MSIILDALRQGRGSLTPGRNPNAAQTDAVLQTLGYGRFNPTTPLNRLKRALGYLAIAVVLAIALWFAVMWLTRAYWTRPSGPESAVAVRQAEPNIAPKPAPAPSLAIAAPATKASSTTPSDIFSGRLPSTPVTRAHGTIWVWSI